MITAWLSQNNFIAFTSSCPISSKKVYSHCRCFPAMLRPMYSDLVLNSTTIDWCLLAQATTALFVMKTYLEVNLEVSRSPNQNLCIYGTVCSWIHLSLYRLAVDFLWPVSIEEPFWQISSGLWLGLH